MIGRSLSRRLEHLETRLLPVAGEPTVITLDFVDTNGIGQGWKRRRASEPSVRMALYSKWLGSTAPAAA